MCYLKGPLKGPRETRPPRPALRLQTPRALPDNDPNLLRIFPVLHFFLRKSCLSSLVRFRHLSHFPSIRSSTSQWRANGSKMLLGVATFDRKISSRMMCREEGAIVPLKGKHWKPFSYLESMAANRRRSGSEGHRFETRCLQGLFAVESLLKMYPSSCELYSQMCEMYWLTCTFALHVRDETLAQ